MEPSLRVHSFRESALLCTTVLSAHITGIVICFPSTVFDVDALFIKKDGHAFEHLFRSMPLHI